MSLALLKGFILEKWFSLPMVLVWVKAYFYFVVVALRGC